MKWTEYCNNNTVSHKYLPVYLEYSLYFMDNIVVDKSFIVMDNNNCVGICFFPIELIDDYKSVSLNGDYNISPLAINEKSERFLFEEIDKNIKEQNIQQVKFYIDPLIVKNDNNFNFLLKYNFIDSSSTDCIVDLRQEKKELWKNLRKSYKALINYVLKSENYEIFIMDKNNSDYNIHELYRKLHHKSAGRVTRSKETFDKQFEMLEDGYASLIGLKYKDVYIGMNYFTHFKKLVTYGSGADDPDYTKEGFNIYHSILWSAINYFKEKNYEYFRMSQPCGYNEVNGFDDYLDKKQINISHFKRGMGSKSMTLFRGIKYNNKDLLLNNIEQFRRKVLDV